jgi:uncharacterized protein Yka (UPF0111/DUF47 family)
MKLFSLLPQEKKFFTLLGELAQAANTCVRNLQTLLNSTDAAVIEHASQGISQAKSHAKHQMQTLNEEVCRTFVTPFEREDLQAFASVLYTVPKLTEKIKNRLTAHHLVSRDNDFNKMMDLVIRMADALDEVMEEIFNGHKLQNIHAKAAVLHELEDQGDVLLGQLILDGFNHIEDTRELILRKDLYEMLEDITDYYRDAANVALQIALKHT